MPADRNIMEITQADDFNRFVEQLMQPNRRLWYRYDENAGWFEVTTKTVESGSYGKAIYLQLPRDGEPFPDHDGEDPYTVLVIFDGKNLHDVQLILSLTDPAKATKAA